MQILQQLKEGKAYVPFRLQETSTDGRSIFASPS